MITTRDDYAIYRAHQTFDYCFPDLIWNNEVTIGTGLISHAYRQIEAEEALGMRFVPVVSTAEMRMAGMQNNVGPRSSSHGFIFRAMVEASPFAKTEDVLTVEPETDKDGDRVSPLEERVAKLEAQLETMRLLTLNQRMLNH